MPPSSSCRSPRRSSISIWKGGPRRSRYSSTIPTRSTPAQAGRGLRPSGRFSCTDWRQRNQTFFSALQVERNVMFMILTLIVLVAALNIISGLIMLVKDKGQRYRHPAHDGRDARRDPAHFPDDRGSDRRDRNDRRRDPRRRDLPQRRIDPAVLLLDFGDGAVQSGALFPEPAAGEDGRRARLSRSS